jgi:hypothetical protein
MTSKLIYITFFLVLTYLMSAYSVHWLEITKYGILYLKSFYLPIAILVSVILFGPNLKGKFSLFFRIITTVILVLGVSLSIYYWTSCSGLGCMGLLFIGAIALGLTLIIYIALYIIQRFKKI